MSTDKRNKECTWFEGNAVYLKGSDVIMYTDMQNKNGTWFE